MNIGKSKITLRADGCTDCGALWSTGWETAEVIEVRIAGQVVRLSIHRCYDCWAKNREGDA